MGTAPLGDSLQRGCGFDIESNPSTVNDWAQMLRVRTTVEIEGTILAIGIRGRGPGRADRGVSPGALLLFNDDSAQTD